MRRPPSRSPLSPFARTSLTVAALLALATAAGAEDKSPAAAKPAASTKSATQSTGAGSTKAAPSSSPSSSATAAPTAAPSGPETADSLYNQGNDAYDAGNFKLAYELYLGAFKLRPSYDIARNLGQTELKLGKLRDAITHLTYSLTVYAANRIDTKPQVEAWLAEAKAAVGTMVLHVEPQRATCRLNDVELEREEQDGVIFVDPGEARVECGGVEGYDIAKRTVTITKAERTEVTLKLAPLARGPGGPGPGPDPAADQRRTLLWVGSAVAVASLGVGAATGVLSIAKAGEADGTLADLRSSTGRQNPCAPPAAARCADLYALRKEQDAFGNVAFWTLVAGGAIGAGTAAYGFVTRPRGEPPRPPRAAVVPVVAPGGAALVVSGAF